MTGSIKNQLKDFLDSFNKKSIGVWKRVDNAFPMKKVHICD
jgi:hypothetical protein